MGDIKDICEFERNAEKDIDKSYRNALRFMLRDSYAQQELNKSREKHFHNRRAMHSLYHFTFGEHPAEKESAALFSASIEDDANAEISAVGTEVAQFYDYLSGYRDAADVLVMNAIINGNKNCRDESVFPICFLYRQYIELSLKDLYLYYSAETEKEKNLYMKNANHNLWHVWENKVAPMIKPLLKNQWQIDEYQTTERYIKEFNDLDSDSYMFRYPITKARKNYHLSEKKINLPGLMGKMNNIEKFFAFNSALLDTEKMCRESKIEVKSYD